MRPRKDPPSPYVWQPGHRLRLLCGSHTYFSALLQAIQQAQTQVYLETYLFKDDPIGWAVAHALAEAARRGVCVRVVVDGFGGRDFVPALQPWLEAAGVRVMIYRPEGFWLRLRRHRLRRMHRKIVWMDGQTAFVGGINVGGDHALPYTGFADLDYAVKLEGPVVRRVMHDTERLWERLFRARFRLRWSHWARRTHATTPALPDPVVLPPLPWGVNAAWVIRDNFRHRRAIENAYLAAMDAAQQEIIIACAYFLPGRRFRESLLSAARRGVRVILILQGLTDHPLQRHASRALYPILLHAGVRLFEYQKALLHAKVAVIDRVWATVGSSNIDPFSLFLAQEANVLIHDPVFARHLRTTLLQACHEGALPQRMEEWQAQPLLGRLACWGAYGLTRLAWGITGFSEQ